MILTGTGTSHGVPAIGCTCKVCASKNRKDKRNRCSAYIMQREQNGKQTHIVIDTGPEFRIQALTYGIAKLDAVLLTHSHADHLNGLDDVRIFSHTESEEAAHGCHAKSAKETPGNGLPVYANEKTLAAVRTRFDYIFSTTQIGGGKPKLDLKDCAQFSVKCPLYIGSLRIIPIPMMHGNMETTGWLLSAKKRGRIHSIAYLTDCNAIPQESIKLIIDNCGMLDHAVIDALRENPHATHFSYLQAMEVAEKIQARYTWLSHISHAMSHVAIAKYCKNHLGEFPHLAKIIKAGGSVLPAYDGLVLR